MCDSVISFMLFTKLLLGNVISLLLQKHSLWEFLLAFNTIPCISQAPHAPAALRSAIWYKLVLWLITCTRTCVCVHAFSRTTFHSQSLSTHLEDANLIYWGSHLGIPTGTVYSCMTVGMVIRIHAL